MTALCYNESVNYRAESKVMFDMSEYLSYNGITPMPDDFDKYWDEAIAEMKSVDPEPELIKALDLPNTECFEMYFTGVGGARIHARFAKPKNITKSTGAVLCFHGYNVSFPEWQNLLVFAGQGLCAFGLDCRGQAGKSEDNGNVIGSTIRGHIIRGMLEGDPKKLLYRSIFLDTAELAHIAMSFDFIDKNRLCTYGGSQGGGLAIACAALTPEVKKTVAYCPFLCDYKKAYELSGGAYEEIKTYFVLSDPLHKTEDCVFKRLGYIDVKNLAHRVKASVKMYTGMKDVTCPPMTQFAMYNNIVSEKEYGIYPDYDHNAYPGVADTALKWFCEE